MSASRNNAMAVSFAIGIVGLGPVWVSVWCVYIIYSINSVFAFYRTTTGMPGPEPPPPLPVCWCLYPVPIMMKGGQHTTYIKIKMNASYADLHRKIIEFTKVLFFFVFCWKKNSSKTYNLRTFLWKCWKHFYVSLTLGFLRWSMEMFDEYFFFFVFRFIKRHFIQVFLFLFFCTLMKKWWHAKNLIFEGGGKEEQFLHFIQ